MPAHLISGGVRSGKTAYAEKLALEMRLPTLYVATARVLDSEMRRRIDRHRRERPKHWRSVECDIQLGAALVNEARAGTCVIIDCLTLWLANLLSDENDHDGPSAKQLTRLAAERDQLLGAIRSVPAEVLIVTNELGSGVTPIGRFTRIFVDEHGITNQRVAELCERLTLVVCGQPLRIKPGGGSTG